jgi:tellurite methyltransferase
MSIDEKASWNRKYSEGSHTSLEPNPLLVRAYEEFIAVRPPGSALDVAGGVGRHAIWLAQRGWRSKLLDISEVGIEHARKNAQRTLATAGKEGLLTAEVADLNSTRDLGGQYDLVLVFYYLQRELFPALIEALRPGGMLVYKTYTIEQKRFPGSGPTHPMFLLEPNELLRAFASLRVLHYHETIAEKGTAEFVGIKEP